MTIADSAGERIALVRGAPIASFVSVDLLVRDARSSCVGFGWRIAFPPDCPRSPASRGTR